MIEIIDSVLQFLKDVLLALALMGHFGDGPECSLPPLRPRDRPHAHPIPAEFPRTIERWRQADLLRARAMLARRLGQPVDRFGDFGRTDEQALDRQHLAA